jgi:glutamate transport system permease protein
MNEVLKHIGVLVGGLGITLELSLLGFLGALLLGTILTVMRVSPITPLRVGGTLYVEVFRNVPLLAFLVLFVFGLPDAGITYSLFTSEVLCLALYFGAYVCEAVRGGINAVPVGQAEAARARGGNFNPILGDGHPPAGVPHHGATAGQRLHRRRAGLLPGGGGRGQ